MPLRMDLRRYLPGDDDYFYDDGRPDGDSDLVDVDAEMAAVAEEFDRIAQRDEDNMREAFDLVEVIRRSLDEPKLREPHESEPLSIAEACCLPELGGKLYVEHEGIPSRHITAKALYEEIKAGRLRRVPPFKAGKFLVSRQTIKEWTECQDDASLRISFGSSRSTTKTPESSGRTATGPSPMERPELAQASALNVVNRLRQRGSSTK
ncbi:hypothetical protein BJF92_00730 [Rhizobium rhizosphaerae]|uniref:Uncharacterized protein n=1 Tax=Xaviernesmea rhizosphaerae TaxID=1672749 RepID=A0A1Q9AEK3_9HYPH|nr:hypothetical protein BJF92_00730 [Xaviernesmea rhizosphaerae]